MDPVSQAIISTLIAGVTMGFSEVTMDFISEKYKLLVQKIRNKFGKDEKVVHAINQLESNPQSIEFQENLYKQFEDFKINQEAEFQILANELLQAVNKKPTSNHVVQVISGNHNAVTGSGGSASITYNYYPDEKNEAAQ